MIKRICRGGAGIFNESCGNLHGDGFERDRSDRSILRKEAKIRLRAAFGLTCKKSAEEPVHLRVRVAAVIERTAGADQRRGIPVRGHPCFAEVKVKTAVLQSKQLIFPGNRLELDIQRVGGELTAQRFGNRALEAVLLVDQKRQSFGMAAVDAGTGKRLSVIRAGCG